MNNNLNAVPATETHAKAKASFDKGYNEKGERMYADGGTVSTSFEIMPGQIVTETLTNARYNISLKRKLVTSVFDRIYFTKMKKSPNHFIMITFLIHSQKLIQLYIKEYFGEIYSEEDMESVKVWPLHTSVDPTFMIKKDKGVTQSLQVKSFKKTTKLGLLLRIALRNKRLPVWVIILSFFIAMIRHSLGMKKKVYKDREAPITSIKELEKKLMEDIQEQGVNYLGMEDAPEEIDEEGDVVYDHWIFHGVSWAEKGGELYGDGWAYIKVPRHLSERKSLVNRIKKLFI